MRGIPTLLRKATVVGVALAVGAVLMPASAQAGHPTRLQGFYADSGDACPYGYTKGQLAFRAVHPPDLAGVDLSGTVVDRPTPTDPVACRNDYYYTTATFTAYSDGVAVDVERIRLDNTSQTFRFTLGNDPAVTD